MMLLFGEEVPFLRNLDITKQIYVMVFLCRAVLQCGALAFKKSRAKELQF